MRTKSPKKLSAKSRQTPLIQSLEDRRLFAAILNVGPGGALTYTGSSVDNNLRLSGADSGSHAFRETAEPITLTQAAIDVGARLGEDGTAFVPNEKVSSILINTALGNDTVDINSIGIATTVNTSVGSGDAIIVGRGPSGGSTNAIDGDLTLMDTGGAASVLIEDFTSPP